VFKVDPDRAYEIVSDALAVGYRHIDTAAIYGNEEGVGRAIADSGVPRDELYVTTKLFNTDQGYDSAFRAFDTSLAKLGLDYVNLYLIHWPCPAKDLYVDSWRALEKIREDGRTRSIGVSNFMVPHLERLAAESDTVPVVNQIELHPYHQQPEVTGYGRAHGIATEAWSPLAAGAIPDDAPIVDAAAAHGKSSAQVILRWHIQTGNIVFPKSNRRERMIENLDIFDFELSEDEVRAISALEREGRVGGNPFEVN
jgi:2,5-diketo-D-gluconate reductase A